MQAALLTSQLRSTTQVWAHRGASAAEPENTLAAFSAAIQQGADGVEFDVQQTSDGQLVVCHDETITRTSTGTGWINRLTLHELRTHSFGRASTGEPQHLPLLDEVLELFTGTGLTINVEIKDAVVAYPGLGLRVVQALSDRGLTEQSVVSSFNHLTLARLASDQVPVALGLLYSEPLFAAQHYARMVGVQALHPSRHCLRLDPEGITAARRSGLLVHAWTLDEPDRIERAVGLGVDAIITNTPAATRGVLRALDA